MANPFYGLPTVAIGRQARPERVDDRMAMLLAPP